MWARFRQHSLFIQGSAWLHGAAALGVMAHPPAWPWAVTAVAVNHAALTAAGLWPRSRLLGPNWTRLPAPSAARREIALTLDDGPDPDITPRVLDQLDELAVRAAFFCIGHKVTRFPAVAREIVRRGHDIENHTQHHSHQFAFLGPVCKWRHNWEPAWRSKRAPVGS
ncbi:MAG: polysaccharide deacetylase family protein [Betaproteobacteria bacterium]|nr:polysaccharide deacetylase family protein [Betaproteobacteria bacterium]